MTPAEIVARARSAIGIGIAYMLGTGGRHPEFVHPSSPVGKRRSCDCSGFVAWCLGTDRHRPDLAFYKRFNGGWLSTDAMVADARSPRATTGLLSRVASPAVGDVVVYGDAKGKQGHCGIVSARMRAGIDDVWPGLMVIHCSAGNYRKTGDAIREKSGAFFGKHGAIFARWDP